VLGWYAYTFVAQHCGHPLWSWAITVGRTSRNANRAFVRGIMALASLRFWWAGFFAISGCGTRLWLRRFGGNTSAIVATQRRVAFVAWAIAIGSATGSAMLSVRIFVANARLRIRWAMFAAIAILGTRWRRRWTLSLSFTIGWWFGFTIFIQRLCGIRCA
jgi:hypothetical protein